MSVERAGYGGRSRQSRHRSRSRSPQGARNDSRRQRHLSPKKSSAKAAVDYSKLIPNYEQMTPAERVKAKMKLQLSQTEAKDKRNRGEEQEGGWERFSFDKNAPLDEDPDDDNKRSSIDQERWKSNHRNGEIGDVSDDTSSLRNAAGSYFSYSSQVRREKRTEDAHEAAMFGASSGPASTQEERNAGDEEKKKEEEKQEEELLSEEVIAMQKQSWQERMRKLKAAKAQN